MNLQVSVKITEMIIQEPHPLASGSLMQYIDFTFKSKDHLSLLGRAWMVPNGQPKGIVNLVHGLGEHSGRYALVGEALVNAGYQLVGFDMRGHGLSEGKRGHAPDLTHVMDDIEIFLNESRHRLGDDIPTFLYGHSLGGNLVLEYGLRRQPYCQGFIVTSPALKTTTPTPKVKVALAKLMAKFMPAFTLSNGLEKDALSRDTAVVKAYRDDVYVHDKISASLGLVLLESGDELLEQADEWKNPLLLMHGTADRICSYKASQQFAKTAGENVELVLWEDFYHETHNDFGKEKVLSRMINWLDDQVK
jgi:alpha-beta hydrolase superfamily lysophospholipase